MECPHCFDDMEYVANGNWTCWGCGAHVISEAIEGLHYFSDGRVHKKRGMRCIISIDI